jgi:hypothetical protein
MRIFGLLGLLAALLIVGVLVKQQIGGVRAGASDASHAPATPAAAPATVRDQGRQIQQQYKEALDAALQQPRAMPDEAR